MNILFPTDFSETAENAFRFALHLTKKTGGQLTLIHVYELPELGRSLQNTSREVFEMMEKESRRNFQNAVEKMREIADDNGFTSVDFNQIMEEGHPVSRITALAKKESFDVIVMGTKGATGLKEVFLGSVASGVIDASPCKVLSIPLEASHEDDVKKLAYMTNYKDEEVVSFNDVLDFSKRLNAALCGVHFEKDISDVSDTEMEDWKKKLRGDDQRDFHVITGEDIESSLVDFYQSNQVDIIAIQPRKRNFFSAIFSRSLSKNIAQHLQIPLLTLPAK
ncbi:MAG: universal stress protein [Bacteroidota bacterium]